MGYHNGLSGLICRALNQPPSYNETSSFRLLLLVEGGWHYNQQTNSWQRTNSLGDVELIYQYILGNITDMYNSYQMVLDAVRNDPILLNVPRIDEFRPNFYL